MTVESTSRGASAGGVYTNASTNTGSAVALSPESLVALCAMQLQKFDETILGRMNEKDKNMSLQEKLANVTSKLERFGNGLTSTQHAEKAELIADIDTLLAELNGDPNQGDLIKQLASTRTKLAGSTTGDPAALDASAAEAKAKADAAVAATGLSPEAFDEKLTKSGAIDWATGNVPGDPGGLRGGWPEAEKTALTARAAQHRAALAQGNATVGNGSISAEDITGLKSAVDSAGKGLSSRNDAIMLELQTLVSQRATSIQMTSNLTNSLLESAKTIAGNIGR